MTRMLRVVGFLAVGCVTAWAQVRSIDVRPFGFRGVTNRDFQARVFSSGMDYLRDGTLVVAFPAPAETFAKRGDHSYGTQRAVIVHLDPTTGKLLHKFDAPITNEQRFIAATSDGGFLLVQEHEVVFYSAQCEQVGSIEVPKGVVAIDVSPSRRWLTLASTSNSGYTLDVYDVVTRASVRKQEAPGAPIAALGNGVAHLEHFTASSVHTISTMKGFPSTGYRVRFLDPESHEVEVGFNFDCTIAFEPVLDDAVAFQTCGEMTIVDEAGHRLLHDKTSHAMLITVNTAMNARRVAYSAIPGSSTATREELRSKGQEMYIRAADLSHGRILAKVDLKPMPRIGGAFALSPDGSELAVLNEGSILFTHLP